MTPEPQAKVKPVKRTDTVILNEVRAVMKAWKGNPHKWRSSNAVVKINSILERSQ